MIDVKLVDRQFPAGQNQDDMQVDIFGRHLPAAGRQIRALVCVIKVCSSGYNNNVKLYNTTIIVHYNV